MKKTIALVLLLVLAMGVLVACNQVVPTDKKIRWENSESWTYDISLANFSTSSTTTNGTYYQDFLYSGETNPYTGSGDRVVPNALSGKYVVTVSKDATNTTVETTQTMLATYDTTSPETWLEGSFKDLVDSHTETSITLKSETITKVVFSSTPSQTPVSSYTKVNGFYIGNQYQSVTKYEISTEYTVKGNKTIAKVTNDGKTTEQEISGTNVIDNNQVLMYVRSFDKTSSGFQDNPQVMVFDPLTGSARKMTFVYNASQNFLLNHKFSDATESSQVATTVNRLDILMDGLPFMTQVNLPSLTNEKLDQINTSVVSSTVAKHTICRFRVGFVSYQLTEYLTDEMVKAIQAKAE